MTLLLELVLVLAIILAGAKLSGWLMARFDQPTVVGEIGFGIIVGPTLLNLFGSPAFVHASHTSETVTLLAELGVLMLMFLAGLETDLAAMRRVGVPALSAGTVGVVLPFVGGWGLGLLLGMPMAEAVFIGTILTATSVSISAQTLIELRKLRTKEGMTILGAAVIDDVLGILLLSVVVAVYGGSGEAPAIWLVALKMLLFFAIGIGLAPLVQRAAAAFGQLRVAEPLLAGALVLALLYSWAAEHLGGVAAITGAYLAGLILSRTALRKQLEHKLQALAYGFFVPIFFVDIGLRADLRAGLTGSVVWLGLAIIAVAVVTKAVGAWLGTRLAGFDNHEGLRVGTGMISRGEVGLIVAAIGLERGVIPTELFAMMVLMVVVTTLITPVLLRYTFSLGPESVEPPGAD